MNEWIGGEEDMEQEDEEREEGVRELIDVGVREEGVLEEKKRL